jgi:hypothetical protein
MFRLSKYCVVTLRDCAETRTVFILVCFRFNKNIGKFTIDTPHHISWNSVTHFRAVTDVRMDRRTDGQTDS